MQEARAALHCFSAQSPHTSQHQYWCKNLAAIKAPHINLKLQHRTKLNIDIFSFLPTWEFGKQRSAADVFSFCRKKAQPKRFFKIQPKFPQFIFLTEELSRKSATVDISPVGMEDSGMAELPRNAAHHLAMLPQWSFVDVYGEALPPPPTMYKDELCLQSCGQKNPRNAESGKGFSFPQQCDIIRTEFEGFHNSQTSCFLWDPSSYSNTLVPGRVPEDAHRRYEPLQTSPHFCFQCQLIQHIHHRKQLLKKLPTQVITVHT